MCAIRQQRTPGLHRFKLGDIRHCFGEHYFEAGPAKSALNVRMPCEVGYIETLFALDDRSATTCAFAFLSGSWNRRTAGGAVD